MRAMLAQPDRSEYPPILRQVFNADPLPVLTVIGPLFLLRYRLLALFCFIKCPGDVILRTYDLIRSFRDAGILLIGRFHSPMEKECLTLLLRGTQPVILCPARSI